MKLLSRPRLPKVIASIALIATAFALPLAATADNLVKFEANTSIANMTAGDTTYASSVNAKYNEVVKVQVIYNNDEEAGSDKTANNVRVKFAVPTTAGVNQTIATTTSADNVTTVKGAAHVTLDGADAYLQYIPGTAVWAHANTANGPRVVEQKISDEVVTAANGVNLGNENPCQAGSVTIQVGVRVPGTSVNKYVRAIGSTQWVTSIDAKAGDTVQYEIAYKNTGNTEAKDVVIRDNLPANVTLVPGTTYMKNDANNGQPVLKSDNVSKGGLAAGTYEPGSAAYVMFNAVLPSADKLACGVNTIHNIGIVDFGGQEYYNDADVTINKTCTTAPTPTYMCNAFDITADNASRKVTVSNFNQSTTNGATFNNAVIDWGDNSNDLTTNNVLGQTHSYSADGTYTVTATLHFTANGADVTASGVNCTKSVTFSSTKPPVVTTVSTPAAPTALVNTGAGQVIGLFIATTAAGMVAFRSFLSRRLTQN